MESIKSFFEEVTVKKHGKFDFDRLAYIAVNEWHWSEEDLMESSIPFVLMLLQERANDIERQEKEMKKVRK